MAFAVFMYKDLSSGVNTATSIPLENASAVDPNQTHKESLSEDIANQFIKDTLEASSSSTTPKAIKLDLGFRASKVLATWENGKEFLANVNISSNRKSIQITDLPQKQGEVQEINKYLEQITVLAAQEVKDKTLKRIEVIEDSLILYYSLNDAQ